MALAVREEQSAGSASVNPTFTIGAGTLATDLVVVIEVNNFYTDTTLTAPTGTGAGAWTLRHAFNAGTNLCHGKVYTAPAVGGAGTVVPGYTKPAPDEEKYAQIYVISGGATYGTAGSTLLAATATAHVAPSVTPSTAADLLICAWGYQGGGVTNYTVPVMTPQTERDVNGINTYRSAYQLLVSAAATGTRTATAANTKTNSFGLSVLITTGAAPAITPRPIRQSARVPRLRSVNW